MAKKSTSPKTTKKRTSKHKSPAVKPVRVGIVGLGRAGWFMHCEELDAHCDKWTVVAACDIVPLRRHKAAQRFACASYRSIEELVADENVEMVIIATRSCDHFAHAALALRAGKCVLLEKPMAVTYDQAKRLRAVARRSRGDLYIHHNRRFEPGFLHVRQIIDSGILGEVYEIKLRRQDYQFRGDWQTLKRFGGGQLLNWGPHIIDHALQLLGSPCKEVWSDLKKIAAVGDAEDHVRIILTGRDGRVVDLEISGAAALGEPVYHIFGTKGALTSDDTNITVKYLDPRVKLEPLKADPSTPGVNGHPPMPNHVLVKRGKVRDGRGVQWIEKTFPIAPARSYDMWDGLYKAVRLGEEFPITLDESVDVMRIVSAAKASSKLYRSRN